MSGNFNMETINQAKQITNKESAINSGIMTAHAKVALTLSNSIIGVSILAMPFCMKQCGVILGALLLSSSSFLTRFTCHLLLKSAQVSRRKTFEFVAFHTFGPFGKLAAELNIIGFMLGILISFYVVIGDLGPAIISHALNVQNSSTLRSLFLIFIGVCVAFPFAMLKEVESLAQISTLSIIFYMILSLKTVFEALPILVSGGIFENILWWEPAGIFHSLPIFALALSCQTQIFEIYDSLPDPSLKHMNYVVKIAVYICTMLYLLVGFFGYIASYDKPLSGNILMSYSPGFITEVIKLLFVLSVALSFPLVVLPCRTSIHSLLFKQSGGPFDMGGNYIPDSRFKAITLSIVMSTLVVGILCPNIEMVLGFIGSTIGIIICIIFPAMMFIQLTSKNTFEKWGAQLVLITGVLLLASCTWANLEFSNVADDRSSINPGPLQLDQPDVNAPIEISKMSKIISSTKDNEGVPVLGKTDRVVKVGCNSADGSLCNNGTGDHSKDVKVSGKLDISLPHTLDKQIDLSAKKIKTQKPLDVKPVGNTRHEPPVPQEPDESNALREPFSAIKQGETMNVEKKELEINQEAVKKENNEIIEKDAIGMRKLENNQEMSLNKQEEILKKLEEQQEQQKKILAEQIQILEELKAHGRSHDTIDHKKGNENLREEDTKGVIVVQSGNQVKKETVEVKVEQQQQQQEKGIDELLPNSQAKEAKNVAIQNEAKDTQEETQNKPKITPAKVVEVVESSKNADHSKAEIDLLKKTNGVVSPSDIKDQKSLLKTADVKPAGDKLFDKTVEKLVQNIRQQISDSNTVVSEIKSLGDAEHVQQKPSLEVNNKKPINAPMTNSVLESVSDSSRNSHSEPITKRSEVGKELLKERETVSVEKSGGHDLMDNKVDVEKLIRVNDSRKGHIIHERSVESDDKNIGRDLKQSMDKRLLADESIASFQLPFSQVGHLSLHDNEYRKLVRGSEAVIEPRLKEVVDSKGFR